MPGLEKNNKKTKVVARCNNSFQNDIFCRSEQNTKNVISVVDLCSCWTGLFIYSQMRRLQDQVVDRTFDGTDFSIKKQMKHSLQEFLGTCRF
jgi:hypothetical protein